MRLSPMSALACLMLPAVSANASENVELNSFLTVGAATSNVEGTYLDKITDDYSLENDSRYGINFRVQSSDRVSGAAQLLGVGREDNLDVSVEWAYVNYSFSDTKKMRVGKLNLQTFLLSDYIEVGYLYPWIRPPEEVYGFNPMRNYLGAEWMHKAVFNKDTVLTSQLFVGSAEVEVAKDQLFAAKNGYGVNFQLDTRYVSVRIGAITPVTSLDFQNTTPGVVDVDHGDRIVMSTFGLSWDWKNFIGYSEYIKTSTDGLTKQYFPDQEGYYLTMGYQAGAFLPHISIASTDGEAYDAASPGRPVVQDSIALGIRYDMNENMAVKFEYKEIEPDDDPLNRSFNTAALPVGETSFDVISLSLDVIF